MIRLELESKINEGDDFEIELFESFKQPHYIGADKNGDICAGISFSTFWCGYNQIQNGESYHSKRYYFAKGIGTNQLKSIEARPPNCSFIPTMYFVFENETLTDELISMTKKLFPSVDVINFSLSRQGGCWDLLLEWRDFEVTSSYDIVIPEFESEKYYDQRDAFLAGIKELTSNIPSVGIEIE